jgi:hypothetical protein
MVLLRVGIDSGSGKLQGPLFADGSFEFVPIPDKFSEGVHTYGNTLGRKGAPLVTYFPRHRHGAMQDQCMHLDPEFETFTYGDPTSPKASLRTLQPGDMLVFYAGLEGWDHKSEPALYLVGYFVVSWAGLATELPEDEIRRRCGRNFHVRYEAVFRSQRDRLVLVQGGPGSRLLEKAHCISTMSTDKAGQPLKVLSQEARAVFGDFGGKVSIQRSPPRWVDAQNVPAAKAFIESLP